MRSKFCSSRAHRPLSSILLLALLLRALIPAGYMPSSEHPFTLQICPDSFPVQLLAYAQHADEAASRLHGSPEMDAAHAVHGANNSEPAHDTSHQHDYSQSGHCIFAVALGAAVPPDLRIVATLVDSPSIPNAERFSAIPHANRHRVQQPRAPPALS